MLYCALLWYYVLCSAILYYTVFCYTILCFANLACILLWKLLVCSLSYSDLAYISRMQQALLTLNAFLILSGLFWYFCISPASIFWFPLTYKSCYLFLGRMYSKIQSPSGAYKEEKRDR